MLLLLLKSKLIEVKLRYNRIIMKIVDISFEKHYNKLIKFGKN
jgi:hypothetical protein